MDNEGSRSPSKRTPLDQITSVNLSQIVRQAAKVGALEALNEFKQKQPILEKKEEEEEESFSNQSQAIENEKALKKRWNASLASVCIKLPLEQISKQDPQTLKGIEETLKKNFPTVRFSFKKKKRKENTFLTSFFTSF